ncbi:PREDICTED: uncharacterized protein LOC109219211 [Nicotiana attenuata]|uniref:uncharacterized protein LOC109219211 n=1 Tax=Nicotiana attenuata TaxID=49451 RepID=UPI0009050F18|nr:PREDICTED: uncharacterized protein LOC109219211 [Nicotiana attenuata]
MEPPLIRPPLPPDPPDKLTHMEVESPKQSYKKTLLDKQAYNQGNYYDMEHQSTPEGCKGKHIEGSIPLSPEEKERLYQPWQFSVIIKVFKRKMPHHMLRSKLIELWKPSERLILIDLGWDFFIVKFNLEESMVKALHLGPWFISGHFLSVRKWEPKFVPQEATLTSTAIWIRLPQLPTEFYDKVILEKVGRKLGKLLKIDQCTSSTLRGRYARICIQVPLESPVETSVIIRDHKQSVIYEGEGTLCTSCGMIGHTSIRCTYSQRQPVAANDSQQHHQTDSPPEESQWKTVIFPRRRKQGQLKTSPNAEGQPIRQHNNMQAEESQVNKSDDFSGKPPQPKAFNYNVKNQINSTQKLPKRQQGPTKITTNGPKMPRHVPTPSPTELHNTGSKRKAGLNSEDPTISIHQPKPPLGSRLRHQLLPQVACPMGPSACNQMNRKP